MRWEGRNADTGMLKGMRNAEGMGGQEAMKEER